MPEPAIPTMPCPECGGSPRLAEYLECGECYGTGRVTPNPLTAEEVAALPDGARVVVEVGGALYPARVRTRFGGMRVYRFGRVGQWRVLACRRAWLAGDEPTAEKRSTTPHAAPSDG